MKKENTEQEPNKPMAYDTLLAVVNDVVGKTVRVIKEDRLDDACGIKDHLRWHVGDEFIVRKIEIVPWGVFLYNGDGNNLSLKRAELVV